MSLKITITLESEGEKRHFHSYKLLLFFYEEKDNCPKRFNNLRFVVMHLTSYREADLRLCFRIYKTLVFSRHDSIMEQNTTLSRCCQGNT